MPAEAKLYIGPVTLQPCETCRFRKTGKGGRRLGDVMNDGIGNWDEGKWLLGYGRRFGNG